jgi:hypothetical protein
MAVYDATKEGTTIGGHHFSLSYVLQHAKDDLINLFKKIEEFKPHEVYPAYEPKVAYHLAFNDRIFEQEVHVVLVASSMIEAMANMLLSKYTDSETFAVLERANPIEKWVTLPGLFVPGYSFRKDGSLYNTLKLLIARRNALTHPKPQIVIGDKIIHRGNTPKRSGRGRAESAGINRHRVGDERAPHKRRSCSIMAPSHVRVAARRHVKQLTGGSAVQPVSSEITHPGCRPSGPKGKATLAEDDRQRALHRSRGV